MECINKKCKYTGARLLGVNATKVAGMFREISMYNCPACNQDFSVAGNVTTKKDWKVKLEALKENFNKVQ